MMRAGNAAIGMIKYDQAMPRYVVETELIVEYAQVISNAQRNKCDQVYLCPMASAYWRSTYKVQLISTGLIKVTICCEICEKE